MTERQYKNLEPGDIIAKIDYPACQYTVNAVKPVDKEEGYPDRVITDAGYLPKETVLKMYFAKRRNDIHSLPVTRHNTEYYVVALKSKTSDVPAGRQRKVSKAQAMQAMKTGYALFKVDPVYDYNACHKAPCKVIMRSITTTTEDIEL